MLHVHMFNQCDDFMVHIFKGIKMINNDILIGLSVATIRLSLDSFNIFSYFNH